jgi:hypothetical protein
VVKPVAAAVALSDTIDVKGLESIQAVGEADFYWEEWDATVGASSGFLS